MRRERDFAFAFVCVCVGVVHRGDSPTEEVCIGCTRFDTNGIEREREREMNGFMRIRMWHNEILLPFFLLQETLSPHSHWYGGFGR